MKGLFKAVKIFVVSVLAIIAIGIAGCYPKSEQLNEADTQIIRQAIFDYSSQIYKDLGIDISEESLSQISIEAYCGTYENYIVVRSYNPLRPIEIPAHSPPSYEVEYVIDGILLGKFHYKNEFYAYSSASDVKDNVKLLEEVYKSGDLTKKDLKRIAHYAK